MTVLSTGKNIDFGSKDCLVYGLNQGKVTATIGLEGVIVVDTPDALLVCKKDKAQDVKKVVAKLKKTKGRSNYL